MSKSKKGTIISQEDKAIFAEANKLKNEDRYFEALELLKQLLPKYPDNFTLLTVAGHVNWELGNLEIAVELFQSAIKGNPDNEAVSLGLFHCLWELDRRDEALKEIRRFMTISYSQDYVDIIAELHQLIFSDNDSEQDE